HVERESPVQDDVEPRVDGAAERGVEPGLRLRDAARVAREDVPALGDGADVAALERAVEVVAEGRPLGEGRGQRRREGGVGGAHGGGDDAERERLAGDRRQGRRQVVGGGEIEGGVVDHAPSSRTTCGSTSASARRRSSAKSISVQRRPVTSTQPTWCDVTSMCSASSYSFMPWFSSRTRSRKRTKAGPASAPHLKKPTPSPTMSHASGTTFLPSAITRSPRV